MKSDLTKEDLNTPLENKDVFELLMISLVFFISIAIGAYVGYTKFLFLGSTFVMMFVFAFLGGAIISIFYEIRNIFTK